MHINIITIFPEFFQGPLTCAQMDKAVQSGLVEFSMVNPRDFTLDKHHSVDDRPYGGGPGMVMAVQPLLSALDSVSPPGRVILTAPSGEPFNQKMAEEMSREENLTIVCGRYEGIDHRFSKLTGAEPVSVGDFILNGGETAALCIIEACARLVPGFMGKAESAEEESHAFGLLEYPHYTRPEEFLGERVPEVLLSGHHAKVKDYRRKISLETTFTRRAEVLSEAMLDEEDIGYLRTLGRAKKGRNLYLALIHYPILNKNGQIGGVSLTNMDVHDISRVSRSYGLGGYYITTPIRDQRLLLQRILNHWLDGPGRKANPDRVQAIGNVIPMSTLEEVIADIEDKTGLRPYTVATSARGCGTATFGEISRAVGDRPVLLILGTASGLAPEVLEKADAVMRPIRFLDGYNHLSVRSATAIIVDRLLGDFD